MCGRYTYFPGEFSDLRLTWKVDSDIPLLKPRYNIAPSQEAPVIVQAEGKRSIELFQWGFVPSWAKDPASGNKMINARAETLAEKPSFKRLLKGRRCLVLSDGFYEWRKEGAKSQCALSSSLVTRSRLAACGTPGSNRMEGFCGPTRSSRPIPIT